MGQFCRVYFYNPCAVVIVSFFVCFNKENNFRKIDSWREEGGGPTFRPTWPLPRIYIVKPVRRENGPRIPFLISRSAQQPADGRIVQHKDHYMCIQYKYNIKYTYIYIYNRTSLLLRFNDVQLIQLWGGSHQ